MKPRAVFILVLSVLVVLVIGGYQYLNSTQTKPAARPTNTPAVQSQPYSSVNNPSSSSTSTVTVGGSGALQPTLPGAGQCGAAANSAQIAISGGATCTTAEAVVAAANGSDFSSNGYSCKSTREGSNTQWSSYWNGDFYAYTCSSGSNQIAFNWQSSTTGQ